MDVNNALIQAGAPQDNSDRQVHNTTRLPNGAFQIQFVPYEHDADFPTKRKKRSPEVGSTSKTTSSERNRKSRRLKVELVGEARKLRAQNMPFPPNVQKAVESYERDKARNRIYLRKKRASEKGIADLSMRISGKPLPSGGLHRSKSASVDMLPSQSFNSPSTESMESRQFDQSQLDPTQESPVPSRAEKALNCTRLNSVDNHRRSFSEKAVGSEFTSNF